MRQDPTLLEVVLAFVGSHEMAIWLLTGMAVILLALTILGPLLAHRKRPPTHR
mgnify:CR=1 FL=1